MRTKNFSTGKGNDCVNRLGSRPKLISPDAHYGKSLKHTRAERNPEYFDSKPGETGRRRPNQFEVMS